MITLELIPLQDLHDLARSTMPARLVGIARDGALPPAFVAIRSLDQIRGGKRLLDIEPRLKRGGKYEMATLALTEGESIAAAKIVALVQAAAEFNRTLGDPTDAAGTA